MPTVEFVTFSLMTTCTSFVRESLQTAWIFTDVSASLGIWLVKIYPLMKFILYHKALYLPTLKWI